MTLYIALLPLSFIATVTLLGITHLKLEQSSSTFEFKAEIVWRKWEFLEMDLPNLKMSVINVGESKSFSFELGLITNYAENDIPQTGEASEPLETFETYSSKPVEGYNPFNWISLLLGLGIQLGIGIVFLFLAKGLEGSFFYGIPRLLLYILILIGIQVVQFLVAYNIASEVPEAIDYLYGAGFACLFITFIITIWQIAVFPQGALKDIVDIILLLFGGFDIFRNINLELKEEIGIWDDILMVAEIVLAFIALYSVATRVSWETRDIGLVSFGIIFLIIAIIYFLFWEVLKSQQE